MMQWIKESTNQETVGWVKRSVPIKINAPRVTGTLRFTRPTIVHFFIGHEIHGTNSHTNRPTGEPVPIYPSY